MANFTIATQTGATQFLNALGDVGVVTSDGALTTGPNAVTVNGDQATLINNGLISSGSGNAITVSAAADTITIDNNGLITGGDDVINMNSLAGQTKSITNTGTISAQDSAHNAIRSASGGLMLNNTGEITSVLGDTIRVLNSASTATNIIVNSGTISVAAFIFDKALQLANDADLVQNSGKILGGIDLAGGNNSLTNRGLIDGNISSLGGDDLIDLRGGTLFGKISTGGGKDTILGSAGEDLVIAGTGADQISGKGGADLFVFVDLFDSGLGANARDHILDFRHGQDVLDLSAIDAKDGGIDNSFVFVGSKAFTKAGQVHIVQKAGERWVELNTDGDKAAEMRFVLDGKGVVTADDFIL